MGSHQDGKVLLGHWEMSRQLGDSQKAGFGDKKQMLSADRGNVELGLEKVNEFSQFCHIALKPPRDTYVEMAERQLAVGYLSLECKRSDLGRKVGHPHIVVFDSRGVSKIPWDMLCVEKPSWNPGSRQRKKGGWPRSGQQGSREPHE